MKSSKMWLGLLVVCSLGAGAVVAAPHQTSGSDANAIGGPSATGRLNLLSVMDNFPAENTGGKVLGQSGETPVQSLGPRATDGLYLVVDMSGGLEAARWPVSYRSSVPEGGWQYEDKTARLVLRRIEAGSFTMGSPSWEFGRSGDELQHKVVLTAPYYIAVFEFTQQQWMRATSYNPAKHSGAARPVENVAYERIRGTNVGRAWPEHFDVDDAAFLGVLRLKTGLAFDLPTEAQWEYACRAGTTTALNTGKDLIAEDECPNMTAAGRYGYNVDDGKGGFAEAHTMVGCYLPNAWGLYDMHGNVFEWCLDWYTNYPATAVTNPVGGTAATIRVARGGSWETTAEECRSAYRLAYRASDGTGFRLVCPVISTQKQIVTFDANGGTCGTPTQTNTILGVYETLPSDVSRAGYIFDGWFSDPTGGHRVYVSSMVTTNTTRTLYARWHPDIQVVTFDPNGGQCNRTTGSYTVDTTYTPLPEATRPGYIFDGWFSAASGGTLVTATNTVTTDLSRTLYAHWTPDRQTVTFDPCGGTCATQTATYTVDSTYRPLPVPVLEHYRFDGWFAGRWHEEAITADSIVTTDPERTFYAHWTRVEQVVTFDPNGGICAATNRAYAFGAPYASFPGATLPHYALEGWYTAPTGGERIAETNEVPATDTRTLYAHWTLVENVVTFDPNGGTCPETNRTYTVGQPYASLPTPTLEHYAAEWYTALSGGEPVTPDTIVPAVEYQTLHAQWTRADQIVTFDPNGGTCDTKTQIQTIGQPYTNLPSATLEHYALAGWFTERDGGDRVDGTIVPATDTRTLYAHWTRVDQIVTFNANGGNCDTEGHIYTIGETYSTLPDATREHYVLDGWYTHWSGGSRVYETSTVSTADTLTLYAHWRRVDQIVTFNPNGGRCDTGSHIYTIGETYDTLPDATREHYVLDGWYTHDWIGGYRVDETNTVSTANTLALYAHWTLVEHVVTFEPNGGSCPETNRTYTVGQSYDFLPTPTLEHYIAEWRTAPPDGNLVVTSNIVPSIEYQTLYAYWTRVEQIVTFDPNGGICGTETQTQTIGQPYSSLPSATFEHYALAGWYTERNGGDRVDGTIVPATDTLTLYAHWTLVEQVVSFECENGTCDTSNRVYTIGGTYSPLPTVTFGDSQIAFVGWYTTDGVLISEDTVVESRENLSLQARTVFVEEGEKRLLNSCVINGNGELVIRFAGEKGKMYALQRTSALGEGAFWHIVASIQAEQDGEMELKSCPPEGWGHGFYRLVEAKTYPAYLVVDMSGGQDAEGWPVSGLEDVPAGGWPDECKTTKLVLRWIEPGTFVMGSPEDELGRFENEIQHTVTLTKPYYMGVFEVTQRQWELAMGNRPSFFTNNTYYATRPVEWVSYGDIRGTSAGAGWPGTHEVDATSFLSVLRAKTGLVFDLPTEAQWEYACRAGTATALNSGKNLTGIDSGPNMAEVGRYWYNGGWGYSHPTESSDTSLGTAKVGNYQPNAWGLYDMHGNVSEWCLDWYGSYDSENAIDPKGDASGTFRVQRGGDWYSKAQRCRSACRYYYTNPLGWGANLGFRLCCPAELP